MKRINEVYQRPARPVRVLQYGEGNFLRAFPDWMIDIANEKGLFDGSIAIVKAIEFGSLERFHAQNNLYTVCLRGNVDGKKVTENRVITSVDAAVDAYGEYEAYAAYARLDSLRFIISNTTEAGIVYDSSDRFELNPPQSFPGKLTKFLFERAEHFGYAQDKGLIMLPVELIDDNGIALKSCVLRLAQRWALGDRFIAWLDEACVFTSTLVDRIVTGYPREEAAALCQEFGYQDDLIVTAEPFGLWVIQSDRDISAELPLDRAGLPVVFTDDQKPYKQRKVRILNGAHTGFVLAAYLSGYDTVRQAINDPLYRAFVRDMLRDEVIPTLTLDKDDLLAFAAAVEHRFDNPFVNHQLLSISLNSLSKWRARCMPSLLGYMEQMNAVPAHLAFSLAALMAFYQGDRMEDGALMGERDGAPYRIMDDAEVLQFFLDHRGDDACQLTHALLSNEAFFGRDLTKLPDLENTVSGMLADIQKSGMTMAVQKHFKQ